MSKKYQIISFYEFKPLSGPEVLQGLKAKLKEMLVRHDVFGTIIIAEEGFNASLSALPEAIDPFLKELESTLATKISPKVSYSEQSPFRKHEIKVKPEIVTLKKPVDISLGAGTHVEPKDWNALLEDPEILVLDTRNDYEFHSGTFKNAVNPGTEKFSELPAFVESELDPEKHKKIAMFCTGGIRCEKFAPYMKARGFAEIYQLRGGILKYLEEIPQDETLWQGECFIFDERTTLNEKLEKGNGPDLSMRHSPKEK